MNDHYDEVVGAYEEGQKAFCEGKSYDSNPYPPNDPDSDKWESGYMDADIYESGDIGN